MGFWGSFTGSDQRRDTRNAKVASDRELTAGYNEAQGFNNQAFDMLTPYTQQGTQDQNTYRQAIGLGSTEERTAAQSRFFDDPAQQGILNQQSNALLRNLNARGQSGGGMAALAGTRVANEQYGGWLNRLQGLGAQGGQFATQQAGIRSDQGALRYGFGATKAGSEINYGNAQSANRNILSNNLLNIAGTAAKAFTGFRGA